MSLPQSLTSILKQMPRIPVNKIRENLVTLRTEYEPESLGELGDSMDEKGQLQPIIVQPANDENYFDLVIGSRRLRAAKSKGHQDVVAYVIDRRDPVELLFIALAENLHRRDLNPFEEAQGFLRLMKEFNLDLKAVAKGVNKPESHVRSRLQLLSMPEEVVEMVAEHQLPIHHVRTLARLPTGEGQVRLARSAVENRLSQSELSAQVRQELSEPPRKERESHELTPVKLQARVGEFVTFLQKVPRRLNLRRMNASEKTSLVNCLQSLSDEARALLSTVKDATSPAAKTHPNLTRSHTDPNNHGQEWTIQDLRRIHAKRRPSDGELAVELGRTVGAIKVMRSLSKDRA
ncbi:ParB/RepB/Spo0J family partition protein [Candidatus Nomurabacteria bacterium]|nr:ParB/RepB/Spo0J family partition protein [Candidatus Nomurabacteria bacterium]